MEDSTERLKLDYEQTVSYFCHLAETRFKLLALVPIVTGTALSLVDDPDAAAKNLAVGLLGFLVTLGVIVYDQRNTQIYDALVSRAKYLEARLQFAKMGGEPTAFGGPFLSRPQRGLTFLGLFDMWHDRGLAIIYASAMAGWSYLSISALLQLVDLGGYYGHALRVVVPVGVWLLVAYQLHRYDKATDSPANLPSGGGEGNR